MLLQGIKAPRRPFLRSASRLRHGIRTRGNRNSNMGMRMGSQLVCKEVRWRVGLDMRECRLGAQVCTSIDWAEVDAWNQCSELMFRWRVLWRHVRPEVEQSARPIVGSAMHVSR